MRQHINETQTFHGHWSGKVSCLLLKAVPSLRLPGVAVCGFLERKRAERLRLVCVLLSLPEPAPLPGANMLTPRRSAALKTSWCFGLLIRYLLQPHTYHIL
jgi:hypothetical protein